VSCSGANWLIRVPAALRRASSRGPGRGSWPTAPCLRGFQLRVMKRSAPLSVWRRM
jgi:hypothetical protein